MLYLITVADIRSVSPVAWTSWKAGLLEQLYRNTAEWLETGEKRKTRRSSCSSAR
jgi:UTP:GlnB (protein PII) uridylyltransferase